MECSPTCGAPPCATCATRCHDLHLVEQGLAQALGWCEELRSERNAAEARLRKQDRVLAQLYADRLEDRRLLAQQAAWLASYVTRMLVAEAAVARLPGRRGDDSAGPTPNPPGTDADLTGVG